MASVPALSRRFAADGFSLTRIDIDGDRSMHTQAELINAGANARFIIADLGNSIDVGRVRRLLADRPPIDVMIHNAGIDEIGRFVDTGWRRQQDVIGLNMTAPFLLTAGLFGDRSINQGGAVLFISSLSHFVSYPGAAVFAGTKDGVTSYAGSLAAAVQREDINVLTVFPGPTRTAHARRHSPDLSRKHMLMDPGYVAEQIFQAVKRKERILVPGFSNRILALVGRLAPGLMELAMKKTILERLP